MNENQINYKNTLKIKKRKWIEIQQNLINDINLKNNNYLNKFQEFNNKIISYENLINNLNEKINFLELKEKSFKTKKRQ